MELDVGSENNNNDEQIRSVLYNAVEEGAIASYITSVKGFQFRRLGVGKASRRPTNSQCLGDTDSVSVFNFSFWFLAEPLPRVEPLAVPGLYCAMPAAW